MFWTKVSSYCHYNLQVSPSFVHMFCLCSTWHRECIAAFVHITNYHTKQNPRIAIQANLIVKCV
uniref:Uncharacterized protein n=1 Tax=Arundo donax TaxID=35708 RepID=A0A0A9C3N9_ARUDO